MIITIFFFLCWLVEGKFYGTVSFSVYRLSTCHMSSPGHCLSTQSYPSAKRAKSHFKNIISTLYTVGGNVNFCSHYGKQYEGFPKKPKNRITVEPSSSIPGYISKKKKKNPKTLIQKDTCTSMFLEALFTIAKIWKQLMYLSTDR